MARPHGHRVESRTMPLIKLHSHVCSSKLGLLEAHTAIGNGCTARLVLQAY